MWALAAQPFVGWLVLFSWEGLVVACGWRQSWQCLLHILSAEDRIGCAAQDASLGPDPGSWEWSGYVGGGGGSGSLCNSQPEGPSAQPCGSLLDAGKTGPGAGRMVLLTQRRRNFPPVVQVP